MFVGKMDEMTVNRLDTSSQVSFAYATSKGIFHHQLSREVWPHYYMHRLGHYPDHIRAKMDSRLGELLAQEGGYEMAKAPPPNFFDFGRFAPHYILAAISPQFETPYAWSQTQYSDLMDSWAGGRRAVHRYRSCLLDMHGPTGFIAWHSPTAMAAVDWTYLRGGPARDA